MLLYTEDALHIGSLLDWFQGLCSDTHSSGLTEQAIRLYRPRYERARKHELAVKAKSEQLKPLSRKQNAGDNWQRERAAKAARDYFDLPILNRHTEIVPML